MLSKKAFGFVQVAKLRMRDPLAPNSPFPDLSIPVNPRHARSIVVAHFCGFPTIRIFLGNLIAQLSKRLREWFSLSTTKFPMQIPHGGSVSSCSHLRRVPCTKPNVHFLITNIGIVSAGLSIEINAFVAGVRKLLVPIARILNRSAHPHIFLSAIQTIVIDVIDDFPSFGLHDKPMQQRGFTVDSRVGIPSCSIKAPSVFQNFGCVCFTDKCHAPLSATPAKLDFDKHVCHISYPLYGSSRDMSTLR